MNIICSSLPQSELCCLWNGELFREGNELGYKEMIKKKKLIAESNIKH